MNEADGSKGHPTAGVKGMEQMVLGCARVELILEHPEHLCRDLLKLQFGTVP